MSSFKNAFNPQAHRERSQPQSRKKFGLLEKHKDYVQRAKAYHKKEEILKCLFNRHARDSKRKRCLEHPNEFYFKMIKSRAINGVHRAKGDPSQYTQEELMLMKTQDRREEAKELQSNPSSGGKLPSSEDVPERIKRELEARKNRANRLEKIHMDMSMQQELQKKGRKRKLHEDEIASLTSKSVFKWQAERKR